MWNQFWNLALGANTVGDYVVAAGFAAAGLLVALLVRRTLGHRLLAWAARTTNRLDDFFAAALVHQLMPLLYASALVFALKRLTLSPSMQKALSGAWILLLTFTAVRLLLQSIRFALLRLWIPRQSDSATLERHVRAILPVISLIIWALGAVFLLDNLGFKISAIVAGLGIGGIAVALAAQTLLGDMFSYFAIMFDRPFELGDFIIVGGEFMGTVEHIGIKTTRIRSLGGEQLIFSNKDLTDSRVRNFKRMDLRRVVFQLGVTYDTSPEMLQRATAIVQEVITRLPDTRFDRAHFASFGDFNLVIEVVYFVLSADYNKYMDVQQQINLAIKEAFDREKIEFAYPTQTLFVQGMTPKGASEKGLPFKPSSR